MLAARSRAVAGLLAAAGVTVLLAVTVVSAALLHARAVPQAAVESLVGATTTAERQLTVTVPDRGTNVADTAAAIDALPAWPVPVDVERLEPSARPGRATFEHWALTPDLSVLSADDVAALRAAAVALEAGEGLPDVAGVESGLVDLLDGIERPALVARGAVYAVGALAVVPAGMALALTGRLVATAREHERRLLRSRGFSTGQLVGVAAGEAVLLAAPAAVAGPFLAAWVTGERDGLGPQVWAAAAAVAAAGALALVVVHQSATDRETSKRGSGVLRSGADALVVVLAVVGAWRLVQHGALVTGSPGAGGRRELVIDPLTTLTPALVLLAGALVTMRIVLWSARRLDRPAGGSRAFSGPMGIWSVARRPGRQAGPALLLVLALAMGVTSLALDASRHASQQARADLAAGADLRVAADVRSAGTQPADLADRLAAIPGVAGVMGVRATPATGEGIPLRMLAFDTAAAPDVLTLPGGLLAGGAGVWDRLTASADDHGVLPTLPVLAAYTAPNPLPTTIALQRFALDAVARLGVLPGQSEGTATGRAMAGFVVDLPRLAALVEERGGQVLEANEWWLRLDDDARLPGPDRDAVLDALAALEADGDLGAVVADRAAIAAALHDDPLGHTVTAALRLALAAALVFGLAGIAVSAVLTVRERRAEQAVLRALGTGPGRLAGVVAVEQGVLLAGALLLGGAAGLGVAWLLLPRIVLDELGRATVPAPALVVPGAAVAGLAGALVLAAAVAVVLVTRALTRPAPAAVLREQVVA